MWGAYPHTRNMSYDGEDNIAAHYKHPDVEVF